MTRPVRHSSVLALIVLGAMASDRALALTPEQVFQRVAPSVGIVIVLDASGRVVGQGSGVVVAERRVVTNRHVVRNAASVKVLVAKTVHAVTGAQCDTRGRDLCLLDVPSLDAPAAEFRDTDALAVGQPAFAVGAPAEIGNIQAVYFATGQKTDLELSLSVGIVSALRKLEEGTIIQTTAALSPGSSGGGLFDQDGRLVGITTFRTSGGENLNMALPVTWVAEMGVSGTAASAPPPAAGSLAPASAKSAAPARSSARPSYMVWALLLVGIVVLVRARRITQWLAEFFASRTLDVRTGAGSLPVHDRPSGSDAIDDYYLEASRELDQGSRDERLWVKALTESKGNEPAARAAYVRARAWHLQRERREKTWQDAVRRSKADR